jgi:hypothetical protein
MHYKVYQLLAHGQWFSPGTPASSTTKSGRPDIAEILLKVTLNTKNQIKSNQIYFDFVFTLAKINIALPWMVPDLLHKLKMIFLGGT